MTSAESPLPHPGVRLPPPLLYVAGWAVGVLLNRWRALPITPGPSVVRAIAATACVVAWMALMLSALGAFRRGHTTMVPNRPATSFVTSGPYRFTRNPMYVSLVVLYLGATLFADSWWPLLFLPVVVIAVQRTVIAREERYLGGAFPAEYAMYRARVRRWL
jgi:protein-S-isoprenylcysteine O-methyltransferase Ste14